VPDSIDSKPFDFYPISAKPKAGRAFPIRGFRGYEKRGSKPDTAKEDWQTGYEE
jgi:hypothetical protein